MSSKPQKVDKGLTPVSVISGSTRRVSRVLRLSFLCALIVVAYFAWTIVGKNLFMDLFSDDYVLDSFVDQNEFSTAISVATKRRDHIIPALVNRLRHDPNSSIRCKAATCCGLIGLWYSTEEKTRAEIVATATPALKESLHDPDLMVRIKSAHALWRIDKKEDDVLPSLIAGWHTGGQTEKNAIYNVVMEMGSAASDMADVLSASLKDPDPMIRRWAKDGLEYIRNDKGGIVN